MFFIISFDGSLKRLGIPNKKCCQLKWKFWKANKTGMNKVNQPKLVTEVKSTTSDFLNVLVSVLGSLDEYVLQKIRIFWWLKFLILKIIQDLSSYMKRSESEVAQIFLIEDSWLAFCDMVLTKWFVVPLGRYSSFYEYCFICLRTSKWDELTNYHSGLYLLI